MRKPIIAANWKMNKTLSEAKTFMDDIKTSVPAADKVESVVCAPALFLDALQQAAEGTDVKIGAENMHYEANGAFTGENSPHALADMGVSYVILGHSERRQLFGETDEFVQQKVQAAFAHGLTPIVCVGESLDEREADKTQTVVERQVKAAFQDLSEEQAAQVVIAYEPIWAIGTGRSSSAEDANAVCAFIRDVVRRLYADKIADEVRIQYGGSVKPHNIQEYTDTSDIDGALVGGASLEADSYLKLLEAVDHA